MIRTNTLNGSQWLSNLKIKTLDTVEPPLFFSSKQYRDTEEGKLKNQIEEKKNIKNQKTHGTQPT